MTKVAGLIPARYSSNRLPGKVLAPILGKPMIQRVYERVLQAEVLDVVLVGTDDERVAEAVQPLLEEPDLVMATLRRPISRPGDFENPAVVKVVVDHRGDALYFSRSRIPNPCTDVPHPVFKHVGLYVYRRDFLIRLSQLRPTLLERVESLEQLRVLEHGHRIRVVETRADDHEFGGFSVDTPEDLARAESMLRERGLE